MSNSKNSAKKVVLIVVGILLAVIVGFGIYLAILFHNLNDVEFTSSPTDWSSEQAANTDNSESTSQTEPGTVNPTQDNESTPVTEEPATVDESTTAELNGTTAPTPNNTTSQVISTTQKTTSPTTTKKASTPTTTKKASTETTTRKSTQEPTTKKQMPETTTAKAQAKNEYDIYRSGNYYLKGKMKDSEGEQDVEMAVTDNSIFMVADFDGISLGVLVKDKNTYILVNDDKQYVELSSALMSLMGLSEDDLVNQDTLNIKNLKPLDKANKVESGVVNGKGCSVYSFSNDDNTVTKVYMDDNTLLQIEEYSAAGTLETRLTIYSVSDKVPENKRSVPADYTKMGLLAFAKKFGGF